MRGSILINTTKLEFLKAAEGDKDVRRLEIWAEILAPNDDFRISGFLGRDFSCFTMMELKILYRNTSGNELSTEDYGRAIQEVVRLAEQIEFDETPEKELLEKLGKPMPLVTTEPVKENLSRTGSVNKPSKRKASEPGALPTRPKAGSATAKVWEIADELYQQWNPDLNDKGFKNYVVEQASSQGINPSTAQVQFSKWRKVQECSK